MLIDKSCQKGIKSIYKCDRCGTKTIKKHRIGVYIQNDTETPKKYCDLCEKCFRALDRGIKKGKKNGKAND